MTRKYRILIVDDDADVRAALRRQLLLEGCEIHQAGSGAEAMALLPKLELDAVVADFDMPGMDGLALLQRVRLLKPQVMRLLLTGKADVHVAARALNEGAAHRFLLKPWDRVDLAGMIEVGIHSGITNQARM